MCAAFYEFHYANQCTVQFNMYAKFKGTDFKYNENVPKKGFSEL